MSEPRGAFGEDGDFGAKLVAGREVVFGLAVFVDAFVFGNDAGDSFAFVNEGGAAELREKIYAGAFHQTAHPFHNFVEGDDIVAFVFERRRREREAEGRIFGEEKSGVIGDRSVEGRGIFVIGDEFGESFGIHDGAGELVGADFASFFEDVDIFGGERGGVGSGWGFVVFFDEVGEMEGAGEAGGACADD